jgi:outer membrane receptor for ferrienterochelin and colicin
MYRPLLALPLLAGLSGLNATPAIADGEQLLEEVVITGVRQRLYNKGMLKDSIQKTEVISALNIEQNNASNLAEAIADTPGVRVNNECSMCGVKRVMLNGLKGEHTNILVDGIPVYTMMAGFYGLDAAASAGIESLEIARGAGASLIAPEAIGGTINIVTKKARKNAVEIDLSGGENGFYKGSVVVTALANEDSTRLTLIGQQDSRDSFDADNNGVSENPFLKNRSATLLLSQDLGYNDNITLRVNRSLSEIFGGPQDSDIERTLQSFREHPQESDQLFIEDDVRNRYIGQLWETAEWIASNRREISINWLHEFDADLNMTLAASSNEHKQDSFYEGFRYKAEDDMHFVDLRFNYAFHEDHLLTFGLDARTEELHSQTNSDSPNYVSDSFDYDTRGFYLQDTWTPSSDLQVALAVRIDAVEADFTDPQKPGTEIDKTIVSPRLDMRYSHSDSWTSRLSLGRGYRAPLSFFESDHGILDAGAGFRIDIDRLERSRSATYAISHEANRLSATLSIAYTEVDSLATLEADENDVPVLAQLNEKASVLTSDLALSYQLTDTLLLSATLENFNYNDTFKQSYSVAPTEKRLNLTMDWDINGWEFYLSASWVGSRDLREYGTPENPSFDAAGIHPKKTTADSYWLLDLRIAREIGEQWQLYAGASNLGNYTQAADMESPLFYEDGAYDVAHIYGPLRGREAYAGVKFSF